MKLRHPYPVSHPCRDLSTISRGSIDDGSGFIPNAVIAADDLTALNSICTMEVTAAG
jgi:hypothetical protein